MSPAVNKCMSTQKKVFRYMYLYQPQVIGTSGLNIHMWTTKPSAAVVQGHMSFAEIFLTR